MLGCIVSSNILWWKEHRDWSYMNEIFNKNKISVCSIRVKKDWWYWIKRWYCQLFVRNCKLRWKGNGSNITILFKYTNAWLVSLYIILGVSIMAAGTFQDFWIYEKYSAADAWINSSMNIYYLQMSAREMWHILSCKVVLYISKLRQNK